MTPLPYEIDVERKVAVLTKHYPSQVEASYVKGVKNRAEELAREYVSTSGLEQIHRWK